MPRRDTASTSTYRFAGGPALRTFVVYPERKDKAPVVLEFLRLRLE